MTTTRTPEAARYADYLHRRWLWRRGFDRTLAGIHVATDAREAAERAQAGRDDDSRASGAGEQYRTGWRRVAASLTRRP